MSFRLLLNLVLIGVLLPALIVPAYLSYEGSISELVNSRVIYRDSQAKTIANAMDRYLLNMQKAVIADSYIPQLHESFSETDSAASQVNELLRMVIAKDEAFVSSAGLISLAGRNRHDTNTRLIGRFEEGTASFVDYSGQRQSTITLQLGAGDYEGIVIASPIKDTNAAVVGFLRLQVALSKLESLMGKSLQGLEDAYRVRLVKTPAGKAVLSSPKVFEQGTPGAAELISLHTLKSLPLIVQVEESYAHFMAPQEAAKRDFYLVVAILISLAVFASVLLSWLVSRPIRQLVSVVDSFQSDDLQQRSTYRGLKEFEHLSEVLNNMADRMEKNLIELEAERLELQMTQTELKDVNEGLERRVSVRTKALSAKNAELNQAMSHLVQNEKLASLGRLVAGVAHELNTPIGVNLTATTDLVEKLKELRINAQENTLTKTAFTNYIDDTEVVLNLMEHNIVRASDLIRSFKEVSVDQASSRKRKFNLEAVIKQTSAALYSLIKRKPYTLTMDIPSDINLISYPGAIEQIITNLVTNSLKHGFDQRDEGEMHIDAFDAEDHVVIIYTDNGHGIAEAHLSQVFDPFYTTKMGHGGSGLGLYILHTLTTGLLQGSVELTSDEAGVRFEFYLPKLV